MKRLRPIKVLNELTLKKNEEFACCFNSAHCVTKNTKLIIVGTITPPAGNGYFYTAPRNRIMGYIDEARGTNLKPLKLSIDTNKNAINEIKNTLIEQGIAFLDVMEKVVRKKDSPYDKDIRFFSLDYETFAKVIEQNKNVKFICNSKLALDCFAEITKNLGLKVNYVFCSQRCTKKVVWLDELK